MARGLTLILGIAGLLLCVACTPNANDFLKFSGYDAQGNRTGSLLPAGIVLTPY